MSSTRKLNNDPLYVTRPFLPPFEEYADKLRLIWESSQLTNNGQFVRELESRLCDYLGVKHVILLSNGDAGLRIAYKALGLTGEVITTPFSYVSTTSSLIWSGLKPVFADIDASTLTISPTEVEKAITPETTAILGTHVYGNPCDTTALQDIADRNGLKIIYDAAHAFGVTQNDRSVLREGDVSMVSLHATKLFHTAEGGLLATDSDEIAEAAEWRRRFGHSGTEEFHGAGINAKMNELSAAMGVCVLDQIETIVSQRKHACATYDRMISEEELPLKRPTIRDDVAWNHSYYPVMFDSAPQLIRVLDSLAQENIHPRRYFFPSLNRIGELGEFGTMPVSEEIAGRIACLPLWAGITDGQIARVVDSIRKYI